jgi:3',5'-cyclic AMP phosphodiesterase CpdA
MPVRLVHLSDLHFGRGFDIATWGAVKAHVVAFRPHLIVVSGDLVDHPSPVQLLAAKCEIRKLAAEAKAEYFVVAGNHDAYRSGVILPLLKRLKWWGRSRWFERIFFNDTDTAEEALAREYRESPGFTEGYRKLRRSGPLLRKVLYTLRLPPSFKNHIPSPREQELVQRPAKGGVLLAMLDSNHGGQAIGFATGSVHGKQLSALKRALDSADKAYLVRIAVVHHHLLPIAFSGGRLIGAEPLMVLHNAGTVLALLAEHRFDLVLHGHKHIAQFARLDLSPKQQVGYSLTVAAAGSCALQSKDPRANCINLISVADNGSIRVESFYYGGGRGPGIEGPPGTYVPYFESMETVKQRAHTRARERHVFYCDCRTEAFEITETGDLQIKATLSGLQATVPDPPRARQHRVTLRADSWFVDDFLELDRGFSSPGVELKRPPLCSPSPERKKSKRNFSVAFPGDALGAGVKYRVSCATANSINMTRWECEERARLEKVRPEHWDKEWVSFRVVHPIRELILTLKLPPAFGEVKPALNCRRFEGYPAYETKTWRAKSSDDEEVETKTAPHGDAEFSETTEWIEDQDMTAHEAENLRFEPESGLWRLKLKFPMVGYNYRIEWDVPGEQSSPTILADVLHQRKTFLDYADEVVQAKKTWPISGKKAFDVLADLLGSLFGRMKGNEKRSTEFFVYDTSALALRPVLSHRTWTNRPMRPDFIIPLGCGVAGVAFQQRRIIPWADALVPSPFVKPLPYVPASGEPPAEIRTMLAIPIFHPSQLEVLRPPPWTCIGVVSFGSSLEASEIPKLLEALPDDPIFDQLSGARGVAHATVDEIFTHLETL